MHDTLALQRLSKLADFRDQLSPADMRVIGECLMGNGYGLEHAAARYLNRRPDPRQWALRCASGVREPVTARGADPLVMVYAC